MMRDGRVRRREDLSAPRQSRRLGVNYDPEAFGRFSEGIARYLGTARFLVFQTGVILFWLAWNLLVPDRLVFDSWERGFVLLTLVLSLQASYAAPLILLATNRQEQRDRSQAQVDRHVAERTQADTEFLARELAGVRLILGNVATAEELREQIEELAAKLDVVATRLGPDNTSDIAVGADLDAERAVSGSASVTAPTSVTAPVAT